MKRILIIDDDMDMCNLLGRFLQKKGYETEASHSGGKGIAKFKESKFDVVLCDFRLGDKEGREVLKEIKNFDPYAIVIIITGYSDIKTAVDVIKAGAFDYITKPFDSEVLLHKIKAILKRNQDLQEKQHSQIEFNIGSYHFNSKLRTLEHGGNSQTLSPKENELLLMLCEYKNDLLPRETALKRIWGSDTYFNGRSMDVYIAKLRKYLKEDSSVEIVNIHGNGFRLVVPE